MLALVPLGTELERIMGSVRLLYLMVLLATSNAIFHLIIALIVAHNPLHSYPFLMHECAIGFSGIIFSMIVIETSLSGIQTRSVFGLFNVPAKWYAWILLVLFQLLATNVSLLGHLCGILSGFAYSYGLFNYLLPGSSFYGAIESSSFLSACIRRPGFILCSGGATYGNLPTHLNSNTASSGLVSENLWRNITSWMPQRETTTNQPAQDSRFPGRARTLGATRNQPTSGVDSDLSLQAGLLENSETYNHLETSAIGTGIQPSDGRHLNVLSERATELASHNQSLDSFEEKLKKLVGMGFEKTLAEVALAAADGDTNIAIEILMSQQG
ncbi:rhomboid-like protein 15 isoform X2 [Dendrobium catenatum]|nr:rhomboid-like protein 15 isoform X2 [Dendrobium catenatum]